MLANFCARSNVAVKGQHGFSIQQLDIEHAGPGQETPANSWQKTIADVDDPGNQGYGDIVYWVVEGNVGAVPDFNMSGGAHIQARRIGSPPTPVTSSEGL